MLKKAIFHYKQAMAIQPNYAEAYNNLAWIYATSSRKTFLNGKEAVLLSRKACELTNFNNARLLDTLAAACAEVGDFEKAIEYQNRAIDLSQSRENSALYKRLKLYQSGHAFKSG